MPDPVLLSFAFLAGIFAFFNPCGMVVLISYISHYFKGAAERGFARNVLHGLSAGALATLGFITLFTIIGFAIVFIGNSVKAAIPWITIVLGAGLVLLGIMILAKKNMGFLQIHTRKARSKGFVSFYEYGVLYALASLGCVLPIFLTVVVSSLATSGIIDGLIVFVAYSVGMGAVMIIATGALALSKKTLVDRIKNFLPLMNRLNAIILIAVGLYLIYFQFKSGFIVL